MSVSNAFLTNWYKVQVKDIVPLFYCSQEIKVVKFGLPPDIRLKGLNVNLGDLVRLPSISRTGPELRDKTRGRPDCKSQTALHDCTDNSTADLQD